MLFGFFSAFELFVTWDTLTFVLKSTGKAIAPVRRVSMQEAQDFLRYRDSLARRVPVGVLLCVLVRPT